jgi:hypothetical protein
MPLTQISERVLVRRFGMKEQNELHENLAESPPTQAGKDAPNKATLATVLYYIFNLIYFLLFLGSCPYVLLSPMIFDGGDSLNARMGFFLIVGFPVAVIAIVWGARYFYSERTDQIRLPDTAPAPAVLSCIPAPLGLLLEPVTAL